MQEFCSSFQKLFSDTINHTMTDLNYNTVKNEYCFTSIDPTKKFEMKIIVNLSKGSIKGIKKGIFSINELGLPTSRVMDITKPVVEEYRYDYINLDEIAKFIKRYTMQLKLSKDKFKGDLEDSEFEDE